MFQSWQSVKVTDSTLESFGRVGRVTSATDYTEGKKHLVDVLLDEDTESTAFEVSQVMAIS